MNNTIGVYCIENTIYHKKYIGSSINIKQRWHDHIKQLRSNCHHSSHLQKAWNKYGEDNFEFTIIEIVEDKNNLINREQYWMDYLQSYNKEKGYNSRPNAASNLGHKFSEEFKQKISKANKGRKRSEEVKRILSEHNTRPFLGKHHTIEAKIKMSIANIGNKYCVGRDVSEETRQKISASHSKTYYGFISPNGVPVVITNMNKFCKEQNLNEGTMHSLIAGRFKQHKGWTYNPSKEVGAIQ